MEMICRFGILLNINAQPGIDGDGSERCFREFLRSTSRSNVLTQKNFLNWEKIQIFLEKLICFLGKTVSRVFFAPCLSNFFVFAKIFFWKFQNSRVRVIKDYADREFQPQGDPLFSIDKIITIGYKKHPSTLSCLFVPLKSVISLQNGPSVFAYVRVVNDYANTASMRSQCYLNIVQVFFLPI